MYMWQMSYVYVILTNCTETDLKFQGRLLLKNFFSKGQAQIVSVGAGRGFETVGFEYFLETNWAVLTHCFKLKHTNDQPNIFFCLSKKAENSALVPRDQKAQLCITAI